MFGVLTRYNKKSVAVISESGQRWTVAPQLLNCVVEADAEEVRDANVLRMRKK